MHSWTTIFPGSSAPEREYEVVHAETSLVPRPLPRKAERESGVLSDILVTWGGVKRRKKCNYCIPRARALHCALWIKCSMTSSHTITRSAIWFELSDREAVTRSEHQPSFLHMRGHNAEHGRSRCGRDVRVHSWTTIFPGSSAPEREYEVVHAETSLVPRPLP